MHFPDPDMSNMLVKTALQNYYQREVALTNSFFQTMDAKENTALQIELERINAFVIKELEGNAPLRKKILKSSKCIGLAVIVITTAMLLSPVTEIPFGMVSLYGVVWVCVFFGIMVPLKLVKFSLKLLKNLSGRSEDKLQFLSYTMDEIKNILGIPYQRRLRMRNKIESIKVEILKYGALNQNNENDYKIVTHLRIAQIYFENSLSQFEFVDRSPLTIAPAFFNPRMIDKELRLEAILSAPSKAEHYYELAQVLQQGESIEIAGKGIMSKQVLYLQAIQLDSNYLDAYIGLANTLSQESIHLPDGRTMDKFELIRETLLLHSLRSSLSENIQIQQEDESTHEFKVSDHAEDQTEDLISLLIRRAPPSEIKKYLPSKQANLTNITDTFCSTVQQIDTNFKNAIKDYKNILENINVINHKLNIRKIKDKEIKRRSKTVKIIEQRLRVLKTNFTDSNKDLIDLKDMHEMQQLKALRACLEIRIG